VQRTIETPDWEWGTAEQAAKWLGVEQHVWDGLVKAGKVPAPAHWSQKAEYWHWQTVCGVSALLPFLMGGAVKSNRPEKSGDMGQD
jgi:hypothetical protein